MSLSFGFIWRRIVLVVAAILVMALILDHLLPVFREVPEWVKWVRGPLAFMFLNSVLWWGVVRWHRSAIIWPVWLAAVGAWWAGIILALPAEVAVSVAIWPFVWTVSRRWRVILTSWGICLGLAEYFTYAQLGGGVVLAIVIGWTLSQIFWYFWEQGVFLKLHQLLKTRQETRRQLMHASLGIFLVILIRAGLLNSTTLLVVIVLGALCIILTKIGIKIPGLYRTLAFFERAEHLERFPGRGIFFFLIGSMLSLELFPLIIAEAAILILAIGDSVTNIAGRHFGRTKYWFNPKKSVEGTVAGIIFSTVATSLLVGFWPALLASTVGMLVEALPLSIWRHDLDDNFVIPIISGIVLLWI